MEDQLQKLHVRLIIIMREIHRICVEHDIKYTLIGGSLIGALRHRGFIPWDDDIDIGMTWNYYCKFIQVSKNIKHDWLDIDVPSASKRSSRAFIKVYDKRTTFIESMDTTPNGVFVDVMPFTYCGNTLKKAKFEFYLHRFYIGLLFHKDFVVPDNGKLRECLRSLVARFFTRSFLLKSIESRYIKLNMHPSLLTTDLDGLLRGVTKSEYFDNYKLSAFEEEQFMIISRADEYLKGNFGDYMQMPPAEKQIPHHIIYLNTELPYTEYKGQ